jgi:hypothetical protein
VILASLQRFDVAVEEMWLGLRHYLLKLFSRPELLQ